jgi:dihydroorotate dehydrogenase electron transfer subunit
VHLRVASGSDIVLRRPFSVHRAQGERIEILYQVLGEGTRRMSTLEPDHWLDIVGPLGRGWSIPGDAAHVLLVAGGLGAAPLGMLVEALSERRIACWVVQGAPTASRLVARDLFESHARRVEFATDDGSEGHLGFVTALSERAMAVGGIDAVFTCGPEPMQRIVAAQASAANVPCEVSLERLMACGFGVCLSCVVSTTHGLKRACADGPVFDATTVLWDDSEIPPRH